MDNSRIIVLGDSFSNNHCFKNELKQEIGWFDLIKNYFSDKEYYNFSVGSKDTQSILDEWTKLLPILNENDILIIWFPYFSRIRVPLSEQNYKIYDDGINLIDRFIGSSNDYNINKKDTEVFEIGQDSYYVQKQLRFQCLINDSIASQLNFLEIIDSLYKMSKSRCFLYTWADLEYKSDIILDKDQIKNKIGIWKTKTDYLRETNGKHGEIGDDHFNFETHIAFFEYLKKEIENGK